MAALPQGPTLQRLITALATTFLLAFHTAGCLSATAPDGAAQALRLTLTASGALLLGETPIPDGQLAAILKKQGATPATAISVEIPAGMPRPRIAALTSQLAAAGYQKVVFKGPRHAETAVQRAPPTSSKPAPRPSGP
jgi:biopolymer transport protein ExbD